MMQRIVEPGHNAWREVSAEDSGVVVDAADYYRAFYVGAAAAHRYVLMCGWQFDSGVPLLRGEDAPPDGEVRFLNYLNGLCELKPSLYVYILAWDFNVVFAAEREWLQRVYFDWMTSPRFRFLFDECAVVGGSQHQKFVIFDGTHGFLGGMDVCEGRWDDRCHRGANPLRLTRGKPDKPYHDVQAWLSGRAATAALEDLFVDRWRRAGGEPLTLVPGAQPSRRPRGLISFGPARVALSRT
ncbi:MAG: phospholipase, partial [Thermodesulfobacteriota bacterium]